MLEVTVAERVVNNSSCGLGFFGRRPDDVYDRYVLGIASGDRVRGGQFPDTESGCQCRHPTETAITISGIAGIEFVGPADPTYCPMRQYMIKELQIEISGHPEEFGDAKFSEPIEKIVTDRVLVFGCHLLLVCHNVTIWQAICRGWDPRRVDL